MLKENSDLIMQCLMMEIEGIPEVGLVGFCQ